MTDHCLRAVIAWIGLALIVAFWIYVAMFIWAIVAPAASALIEAATARPEACAGLSAAECMALAQEVGF